MTIPPSGRFTKAPPNADTDGKRLMISETLGKKHASDQNGKE
jgi:hypothetical protein